MICTGSSISRLAFAPLVLLSLSGTPQASDDLKAFGIRGVSGTPSKVLKTLAETTYPTWHNVSNKIGETLYQVLKRNCGDQPIAIKRYLIKETIRLNRVTDIFQWMEPGKAAAIPPCLKVVSNVRVKPNPWDNSTDLLKRTYGVSGPITKARFYNLNMDKFGLDNKAAVEERLTTGNEIFVPFSSEKRVFMPKESVNRPVMHLIKETAPETIFNQMALNYSAAHVPDEQKQFEVEFVPTVELSDMGENYECGGVAGELAPLFDVDQLKTRFATNAAIKQRLWNTGAASTTVGIVDSGIVGHGSGVFAEKFFTPNVFELTGRPNRDNDHPANGHRNDLFGSNFAHLDGKFEPTSTDPKVKSHGTKMASLILGGPSAATAWTGSFDPPIVRLRVADFSSRGGRKTVHSSLLPDAIEYLHADFKPHGATIINLSLKVGKELTGLQNVMNDLSHLLFVVAAGNGVREFDRKLDELSVYPALYGGKGKGLAERVVTVGAHDLKGALAPFSNFSADNVDLLAPGCAVPVVDTLGRTVPDNGTSPAAAITSFAAALVRSLGENDPIQIKNRLILGTDHDAALQAQARSSGRLNIVKSISLYEDVIEVKDGGAKTKLIFGALRKPEEMFGFCDFRQPPESTPNIRKLIPDVANKKLTMWSESDGRLASRDCKLRRPDDSIGEIRIGGTVVAGPKLHEVKEIILGNLVARD